MTVGIPLRMEDYKKHWRFWNTLVITEVVGWYIIILLAGFGLFILITQLILNIRGYIT